jgi:hypothetical protein
MRIQKGPLDKHMRSQKGHLDEHMRSQKGHLDEHMRKQKDNLDAHELLAPHLCFRQFYELTIFDRISVPGDEFALHGSGLLCRDDHELVDREDNNNFSISVKEEEFRYGPVVRVPE